MVAKGVHMTEQLASRPLTQRTYAILRWIGQGGLATRNQLARRFWPGGQYQTVHKHLYRLRQAGYLLIRPWHVPDRHTVLYALTCRSSQALQIRLPAIQIGWPSNGEYTHLILGQETRLLLEQQVAAQGGEILEWRSDRLLRHLRSPADGEDSHEIPDAEVDVRTGSRQAVETWAVEIDGQYYGAMLAAKAAHYAEHPYPVLWACRPQRAATVYAAVRQYSNIQLLVLNTLS